MKKMWIGIIILSFVFFFFAASSTYSYYVDEYNKNINYKLAKWIVVVNDKDITLNKDKEFIIDNYQYSSITGSELSEANNKFAPGMQATFTIEIDPEKVDVSFDYYLDIDMSEINNPSITLKEVSNSLENIVLEDDIYHGYFDIKTLNQGDVDVITVTLEWADDGEIDDAQFVSQYEGKLEIPIKINLKQRME